MSSVRTTSGAGASGPSPLRRRRLSRGLIAAGGGNRPSSRDVSGGDHQAVPQQGDNNNNTSTSTSSGGDNMPPLSPSSIRGEIISSDDTLSIPLLPKPGYSGRIALACVQNALKMGVITKFSLCPQGKARKSLVIKTKAARERNKNKRGADSDNDRAEEIFLQNPPYRGNNNNNNTDAEEEYSSGDDDDFDGSIEGGISSATGGGISSSLHSTLDARHKEPYFIPTGPDAASMGLQGGQVPGKLPFNYRKVRYFDSVTASDRAEARQFLQSEINNAKKLRSKALSNHLKKMQNRERERMEQREADPVGEESMKSNNIREEYEKVDLQMEQTYLATALSRFPHELTPTLSAALLIESLAMNHHESIEGMAKCYDGIVSAGTALLNITNDGSASTPHGGKPKLTTSEIMGALAPLLITTLEQSSGEVIVELTKLRNYCGTRRYQRRFVQRIAPFLVRPPNAAMWCLRHQSDIEPIIAAVEMILDNATEVFSPGWFERGRNMLKDTQRAESLRSAASQLRRLNSPSPTDGLLVGLSSTPGSHVHKRVGGGKKEGISITNDSLAEWEVVAIDKEIRQSILDVFSRDWSRISTLNLTPKESETTFGSRSRRGISTAKSKEWQDSAAGSASSSQVSHPSSITKSPRSHSKLPLSPRSTSSTVAQLPSADALESTFGPSFSSQTEIMDDNGRPTSPTDYPLPAAPLSPRRDSSSKTAATPKTPPTHYHEARPDNNTDRISMPNFPSDHPPQHSSPGRGNVAPLSPQSSVGNTSASSLGTRTSVNQMSTTTREQYRALTSTAPDRKRTVAACRALRAQITQFEDAFFQMHGRAPKGAAERAPLASTYMQYREWKRAIRADAACRIQALCRGARLRLMLSRSDDPAITRFVLKYRSMNSTSKPLNHLRIPLDMGGADEPDTALSITRLETRTGQRVGEDDSVEVFPVPSNNWRNRQQRSSNQQQQQHQQHQQPSSSTSGSSPTNASPNHRSSRSRSSSSLPDVSVMSLAELQQRKRELKQQLKLYDMNFHKQHGRMPEKREKEPIRHLYESYNAYKNQISTIEKGEAQPGPGTAAFRSVTETAAAVPITTPDASPTNVSPTYNSGETSPNQQGHFRRTSSGGGTFNTDSVDMNPSQDDTNTATASEVSSQDLASLKAEKATLHQMLRSYEKDFFKQHKRQVSSFADIRPVAGQYRRYKEIKKAIASKSLAIESDSGR